MLVATASPEDVQTLHALERALGSPIKVALADPRSLDVAIERALLRIDRPAGAGRQRPADLDPNGVDAVSLLDELDARGGRATRLGHPHGTSRERAPRAATASTATSR